MNIALCIRDVFLGSQLADLLVREGYDYELFKHESALMRVLRHRGGVDLVLIDIGLEPAVEESVLSWLSCRSGEVLPVVLVSSHWNAQRVAMALEAGADDCIAKPFDNVELLARLKAVLRRAGSARSENGRIDLSGFTLDKRHGLLLDRGKPVTLTPREFALAWMFFSNPGASMARESISLAIWGTEKDIASRTIEQHVYKLRKKIKLCAARGVMIRTTYGQGYRLELCEDRPPKRVVSTGAAASRLTRLDAERNSAVA
jgi:DNA-binding response OmpR family regulator